MGTSWPSKGFCNESEVGSRKTEVGSRKPEDGSRKSEAGRRKTEDGSRKPQGMWWMWTRSAGCLGAETRAAVFRCLYVDVRGVWGVVPPPERSSGFRHSRKPQGMWWMWTRSAGCLGAETRAAAFRCLYVDVQGV